MNGSNYRWVIVAAGGLLGCVAIGGMFSLPVLLQADCARHRLVGGGHLRRHDHRLPRDGLHQHDLGHAVGQVRAAAGGIDGIDRDRDLAWRSQAAPRR